MDSAVRSLPGVLCVPQHPFTLMRRCQRGGVGCRGGFRQLSLMPQVWRLPTCIHPYCTCHNCCNPHLHIHCRSCLLQAFYKTRKYPAFQTTIYLPSNAAIKNDQGDTTTVVDGPPANNQKAAKNAAALAALNKLHEAKRLNDFLHPSWGGNRRSRQLGEDIGRFNSRMPLFNSRWLSSCLWLPLFKLCISTRRRACH